MPAFIGLAILLAINIVFIIDIERTLDLGAERRLRKKDEGDWGFGQILAIVLLLLPLRDLIEAILSRRLKRIRKERQKELNADLKDAIVKEDFDAIKRAIDRGSGFPSPKSTGMVHMRQHMPPYRN